MGLIMAFSFDSRPIQTLVNQIKNVNKRDGIDLRPKYQRGYIWGGEFKDKLMYSIVKGYPIGNVSLRVRSDRNDKGAMQEVVDGQQRLTTIYNFMNDEHNIQGDLARKIIEYIVEYMGDEIDSKLEKLKKRLHNKGNIVLKYSQLPDAIKENIQSYNVSITNITNASDNEITEYFRFLQNQERLRAGEIINSVPESALENYLTDLKDKDTFLRKVNFPNDRKQFDRVFYSILGLIDGQIGFGVMDKIVLGYAAESVELSETGKKLYENLRKQVDHIADSDEVPTHYIKSNARCMKFFLLLSAWGLVDFTHETKERLKALDSINQKLSAFSSAKADSVQKAFYGYNDSVIEEYRLIALISKGGHSAKRVYNRMQILAHYVNSFDNKITGSQVVPV